MFVVRPARLDDLDGVMTLGRERAAGMTTFPRNESQWKERLEASVHAFQADPKVDEKLNYLLLAEDTDTGAIVGTSALIVGIGLDQPFYSYRILHHTQVSSNPPIRKDTELLQLSNEFVGATEVATLFLHPEYRKEQYRAAKLGKLLAKSRYMFMAAHIDRFPKQVVAEIRGWVDDKGNSPFWDAIGHHFFGLDFHEADDINGNGNSQFISDLMPKFPIYTALLPQAARDVIARPHEGAAPAARLLEKEGFRFSGAVDIFDGGPTLDAPIDSITTVRNSKAGELGGTVDAKGGELVHLAANPSLENFGVTLTNVVEGGSGLWIPEDAADLLKVKAGDTIHYAEIDEKLPRPIASSLPHGRK